MSTEYDILSYLSPLVLTVSNVLTRKLPDSTNLRQVAIVNFVKSHEFHAKHTFFTSSNFVKRSETALKVGNSLTVVLSFNFDLL